MIRYAFLLLFIPSAWGESLLERPCKNQTHCIHFEGVSAKIWGPVVQSLQDGNIAFGDKIIPGAVYFQRGTGKTCLAALEDAKKKMLFNFPELECGHSSGSIHSECKNRPCKGLYKNKCFTSKGKFVAWFRADNSDKGSREKSPSGNIGTVLIMKRMADDGERKARASRMRD